MADEDTTQISASEQKKEDWMNSKWRPMMGWMYMCVCFMDFVGFPVLWSLLQALDHGAVNSQWQPLTLQGAGLFHLAMGAVIGISAYGRTQEKLGGAAGPTMSFPQGAGTTYVPPGQGSVNVNNSNQAPAMGGGFGGASNGGFGASSGGASAFGAPAAGGFGAPAGGFGSPAPVTNSFGSAPLGGNSASSFGASPSTGASTFGSSGGSFGGASATPTVTTGFGGKPAPTQPDFPAI